MSAAPPRHAAHGDRWIDLLADRLPVEEVHAFLADERAGGTALFVGTTRRWTGSVETPALHYDAYAPMAVQRLHVLADEATARWQPFGLVLLHRVGVVAPREASVIVGVATAHRDAAFEACRWLIDTLKADVPIWKRDLDSTPSPIDSAWR